MIWKWDQNAIWLLIGDFEDSVQGVLRYLNKKDEHCILGWTDIGDMRPTIVVEKWNVSFMFLQFCCLPSFSSAGQHVDAALLA